MAVFGIGVIAASRASARVAVRIGRNRLVAVGLVSTAAADLVVAVGSTQLLLVALGILLLGLGFMFAHSSLLTTATQFAAKARGTARALVAFAFMVGGAVGTALGGRLMEGHQELPRVLLDRRCRFGGFERSRCVRSAKGRRSTSARTQANEATPSDRVSGDPHRNLASRGRKRLTEIDSVRGALRTARLDQAPGRTSQGPPGTRQRPRSELQHVRPARLRATRRALT